MRTVPVCPKCGAQDHDDDGAAMPVGITVYKKTCDGCGCTLRIERTVEAWYSVQED